MNCRLLLLLSNNFITTHECILNPIHNRISEQESFDISTNTLYLKCQESIWKGKWCRLERGNFERFQSIYTHLHAILLALLDIDSCFIYTELQGLKSEGSQGWGSIKFRVRLASSTLGGSIRLPPILSRGWRVEQVKDGEATSSEFNQPQINDTLCSDLRCVSS